MQSINIFTDSKYSILVCGKTGLRYRDNNYLESGKPVPNKDLIGEVIPLVTKNIKFTHILAHTGFNDEHSRSNEIADRLANSAAQEDLLAN